MDITFEKQGKIGLITLNRPEHMNAWAFQMLTDLKTVFSEIRKDPDVYLAVVTGTGQKAFCVGQDLN